MKEEKKKNVMMVSGLTLGFLALAGAGCANDSDDIKTPAEVAPIKAPAPSTVPSAEKASENSGAVPTKTTVSTTNSVPSESAKKSTYKDGTYTAKVEYDSPAGKDPMAVTVVLANDIITSSNFDVLATSTKSLNYQKAFSENYKSVVVGKNLDAANVGIISGASLTSAAFNKALVQIKAQAK